MIFHILFLILFIFIVVDLYLFHKAHDKDMDTINKYAERVNKMFDLQAQINGDLRDQIRMISGYLDDEDGK